jgi:uncharacterized spore protein YtfJ
MDFSPVVNDTLTVKQAFGEPYTDNGLTVIPAAAVAGMAGGGSGHNLKGEDGEGGGFAVTTRPLGAYVIKADTIRWRPALDVNRLAAVAGAVLIAYIISRARTSRARPATPVE